MTPVFTHLFTILPARWRRRGAALGPVQVLITLMTMSVLGSHGYERTLRALRERLGHLLGWDDEPCVAAFSQARYKFTKTICLEAVRKVSALCGTARQHPKLGYGGWRLLALDGTKLPLPAYRRIREHFGCPRQAPQGPQASLTVLWDVGANQPADWRVDGYRVCERLHGAEMVKALQAGDLLLADSNFASRRILLQLHQRGAACLMSIRCAGPGSLREVLDFVASGALQAQVELSERDHHGRPRPGAAVIPVRLLRLALKDGSVRVLITTLLDQQRNEREALIALFAQRWGIETAFREMKLWHGLQNFRARTALGIFQEISAVMIFQLLCGELEAQARIASPVTTLDQHDPTLPDTVRTPPIRFNRRIIADGALDLLFATGKGDLELARMFNSTIQHIWRYRQKVRPRRNFPRERKSPARGFKDHGARARNGPVMGE